MLALWLEGMLGDKFVCEEGNVFGVNFVEENQGHKESSLGSDTN